MWNPFRRVDYASAARLDAFTHAIEGQNKLLGELVHEARRTNALLDQIPAEVTSPLAKVGKK